MNISKLKNRCEVLRRMLISLKDLYPNHGVSSDQKKFMETMFGAGIFYLPNSLENWTGKISEECLKQIRLDKKYTPTKEHQYPRKIAATHLLNNIDKIENGELDLVDFYLNNCGKYNFVTRVENTRLKKHQKSEVFKDPETSYVKAKINLVEISKEEYKKLKKGIDILK
jgi:hypothetical protein